MHDSLVAKPRRCPMSISVDEPTSFLMELLYNLHKATPEKETQRAHRSMIR